MIDAYGGGDSLDIAVGILLLVVFGVLVSLVVQLIIGIIRNGFKSVIKLAISIGIIIIITIIMWFVYQNHSYSQLTKKVSFIQDKVSEISAAKLLGDSLMLDGAIRTDGVTIQNINNAAASEKERLNSITYPSILKDYVDKVGDWADKIAIAKDYNSWKALSDEPEKFEILIEDSWVRGLLGKSIDDLAVIRDNGKNVIQKKDRGALRFVTARLTTIDHFLTSLETYQTVASSGMVAPAFAKSSSGAIIKNRGRVCYFNGKSIACLPEVRDSARAAKDIARKLYTFVSPERYTAPDTTPSLTNWDQSFEPIGYSLDEANMQYLGGIGLHEGEKTDPELPLRVQTFYNSCKSRGGSIPATSVKERLPTTEGGYNCKIGSCWEFLTYSGKFYSGGNLGCPEQGLTPRVPVIPNPLPNPNPSPSPKPTPTPPKPTSYDGNYSIRYSYGNCGTNVSGVNLGNLGVFDDSISVKNNFVYFGGYSAKIDSNGRAVWSDNLMGYGTIQQVFNFTSTGVSGTFTFKVSAEGAAVGCNGTFSGSKR
uniref:Uncharacterized protein n=1 Tax=candidate division CPR3 bacterium TaxID=2268181 RepID=A0A7C4M2X5_UNCC3